MSTRELWTAFHGMVLGAIFLLAFTGGFVALRDFRSDGISADRLRQLHRRLIAWTCAMAVLAWLTVIVGSYVVYPWYRAKPPAGTTAAQLAKYPRSLLLANPQTAGWHEFGMEWKEHVAWLAPILATAVAVAVTRYGRQVADDPRARQALLILFTVAFFAAAVAGLLGALINKVAPTR